MNDQLDLFGVPPAGGYRHSDPATSKAAATDTQSRLRWGTARHQLLAVYEKMAAALTDEQTGSLVGFDHVQATRRISELVKAGLVEPCGTAPLRSGHLGRLCRITPAGVEALEAAR
ncbi:MAG: hypothetical protein ACYCU7_18645 [Acidimicrobiales bacterium]